MNTTSPDNSRTACCGDSTGGRPRLLSLLLGLLLLVIGGYVALADPARVPTGEIRFGDTGLLLVLGLFTGLQEGASSVFAATVDRARARGLAVEVLPERPDVDTFEDLVAMWRARLPR